MVDIRPAHPDDRTELVRLLRRASLATGEHVRELLDDPDAMDIPPENLAHTLVAEAGGRVVGFCTVLPLPGLLAEVDAVFVDPGSWRKGLGKALVIAAERRAIEDGVASLEVVSGRYAQPFYEALGFKRSGVEATRFGLAVRLTKRLIADPSPRDEN